MFRIFQKLAQQKVQQKLQKILLQLQVLLLAKLLIGQKVQVKGLLLCQNKILFGKLLNLMLDSSCLRGLILLLIQL
jgi:hypothetical protein